MVRRLPVGWPYSELKAPGDRFLVLDGLRGVAALVVMLFHFFPGLPEGLMSHGYLAVDFFFLLSGFVIAWNYDRKFDRGLSVGRFALIRAIRLYPLAVAGVGAAALLRLIYPHPAMPSGGFLYEVGMNLALLPNALAGSAERFPLNPPSWSLFYELAVNISYAVAFPLLGRRTLLAIVVVLGVMLAAVTVLHGSVELLHQNIALGCLRTAFSFGFGVLIARSGVRSASRVPAWVLYLVLLVAIGSPLALIPTALYEIVAIGVVFPLVVRAGVAKGRAQKSAIEQELGELSYPVYVLHLPLLGYVGTALGHFLPGSAIAPTAAAIVPLASALAWRWFDRPVRIWLSRMLLARPVHPNPVT